MDHLAFKQYFADAFKSPAPQFDQSADFRSITTHRLQGTIVTILTAHAMTAHHMHADIELLERLPGEWNPCAAYAQYISEFWRVSSEQPSRGRTVGRHLPSLITARHY